MTDSKHSITQAKARRRARRVVVSETPPPTVASPYYADAFEIARSPTDQRSAEQWARDFFERLPAAIRRPGLLIHRWILGFSLGPWTSSEHIFGWRIVTSEPELLHLEARSTLFGGHMVWRLDDERLTMTTFIQYETRRTAPAVWAIIGNLHRGSARCLLGLAATVRED